jgi:CHAD domain-containing protein
MSRRIKPAPTACAVNGPEARNGPGAPASLGPDGLKHLAESLRKQGKRYRRELKRCQKHFSEKAVHESRVATRRLLSTRELLAGFLPAPRLEKAKRALKRHLDIFDELRDTQVQLVIVRKMVHPFPGARPFKAYLLKREQRFAKQTRKAIKRVKSNRLGELIAACRTDIAARSRPPTGLAAARLRRSIDRAFARTVQLRGRIVPQDTRTIHCTRVAFKKFRYMVEALADYLPGVDAALLEAMRRYQGLMGQIQDLEVLLLVLDKFLARKKLAQGPAIDLREELANRRQALVQTYLGCADQLLQFWPAAQKSRRPLRNPILPITPG